MQMKHMMTGLKAQLVAQEAPMGAGVVHAVSITTFSTRPRSTANQARMALITGTRMKGRKKTGFMMMGAPNRIGSLMLKNPGTTPIRPMVRRCTARLRISRNASGKVEPTPPIKRK